MSNCSKCFKTVNRSSNDTIRCLECKSQYHLLCAKLTETDVAFLVSSGKEWQCEGCLREKRLSRCFSDSVSLLPGRSDVTNLNEIKSVLDRLESKMVAGHKKLEQDLAKSLNACQEKIGENSDILRNQQVIIAKQTEIIEHLRAENVTLKKKVNELEIKFDNSDQYSRSNTLEIYGIPETQNENVTQTVIEVCEALDVNIKQEAIDVCHRLKKQTNRPTSGIIVRFVRRFDKETVLKNRKIKEQLTTRHLGYDSDTPVYVNQSLTRNRKILFAKARRIKFEKRFKYLWIDKGGNIKLRKDDDSNVYVIQCNEDIEELANHK